MIVGAALLLADSDEGFAQDAKPAPKQADATDAANSRPSEAESPPDAQARSAPEGATRDDTAKAPRAKRARKEREPRTGEKSDADLAARKPPPATETLDPKRAKFTPVKTQGTGAGQAHDESGKLATPPNPTASNPAPVAAAPAENESDEKLRERVQARLLADRKLPYTARMVSVAVKKGVITLTGEVNTDYERTRVTQAVDGMRGRHDVINQISVRNRSPESVQAISR
jgi:hypothetical protein